MAGREIKSKTPSCFLISNDGFDFRSSVNVQCCYNELFGLRQEFENEIDRHPKIVPEKTAVVTEQNHLKTTIEQFESTRIDNEEKEINDQLPDYSIYDDDVNASILRVLRNEEGTEETTTTTKTTTNVQVDFVDFVREICMKVKI